MPDRPSLAVVIVSYNVRGELDACLRSLASDRAASANVCVVDNGSSDGTPQMVQERWPGVQLIQPGGNLGFARGNNVGIRATTSPGTTPLPEANRLHRDHDLGGGRAERLVVHLKGRGVRTGRVRKDQLRASARKLADEGQPIPADSWLLSR